MAKIKTLSNKLTNIVTSSNEDTTNRCGFAAYSLDDEIRLLSMLNTLKVDEQFYRSSDEIITELHELVNKVGKKDPYFLAQCIVYSRCIGEGMRTINHLAAVFAIPYISGTTWGKKFYDAFDKHTKIGGCIYRLSDMTEIKDAWNSLYKCALPNTMKKGFASALENADEYTLAKYKQTVINIANLVHPNPNKSNSISEIDNKRYKTLDAIIKGMPVIAATWESKNSKVGQDVAKAVKNGELTEEEAKKVLAEKKTENWEELLSSGRLGILAALRNIRNILDNPTPNVVNMLCNLFRSHHLIISSKIMPYQIDTAYEVVRDELMDNEYACKVMDALIDGYNYSIPNLSETMPGKTCVMVDCSGSMHCICYNKGKRMRNATACEKAGLIAATIAKSTNADIIRFGSHAELFEYNSTDNVFVLGKKISNTNMGGTNIAAAFDYIRKINAKYDRIIILSDNECNYHGYNGDWTSTSYKKYANTVCNPYVYCIDFCAYGTKPLKSDKIRYYFGYGYSMFDDISTAEFNAATVIDKVKEVVIDPNYVKIN